MEIEAAKMIVEAIKELHSVVVGASLFIVIGLIIIAFSIALKKK